MDSYSEIAYWSAKMRQQKVPCFLCLFSQIRSEINAVSLATLSLHIYISSVLMLCQYSVGKGLSFQGKPQMSV